MGLELGLVNIIITFSTFWGILRLYFALNKEKFWNLGRDTGISGPGFRDITKLFKLTEDNLLCLKVFW